MSDTETPEAPAAAEGNAQPQQRQVLLQKIYVKDASIEVPLAPQIFTRQWQPQLDVQVNTEAKPLETDGLLVTLAITVTAKLGEDTAFLVEAHQSGIFTVRGFTQPEERAAVAAAYCPNLLFPFARETIADMVQRAGFPQFLLQPINFDAIYLEHLQRSRAEQAGEAAPAANNLN
ncbi:protein-export chaperone SecB [Solimonas marina]|uniref:Protein-export protein SecB n=1 Tax=Solimonas marina TaxID=2714601 RepID=A0A969W681_9GAMM|nr:protein-export chaperone SecB [Solimonas marina]NKF20698.1 protein-export chaperone SecB [Solimonas marina]